MDYIYTIYTTVQALVRSFFHGPTIEIVDGTKNIIRIPLWYRGRLMAVYLPADIHQLEYGPIKYLSLDGNPLNIIPLPGIKVQLTPDMFNAKTAEVTDYLMDETYLYDKYDSFSV